MNRKKLYYIDGGHVTSIYPDSTMTLYVKDIYGDVYKNQKYYWELVEDKK